MHSNTIMILLVTADMLYVVGTNTNAHFYLKKNEPLR